MEHTTVTKAEFESRMETIDDKLEKLREDYTQLRVDFADSKGDIKTLLASMSSMEKRFDSIVTQAVAAAAQTVVSIPKADELTTFRNKMTNILAISVCVCLILGLAVFVVNNVLSPQAANFVKPAVTGSMTH